MKKVICLDTETTGLDRKKDEILQLSIIDGCGNVLFHNLIKPVNKSSWYEAEKIHGIKPSDVANCKSLSFYKKEIEKILQDADIIVGYNIMGFDFPMLFNNGIENNVKSGSVVFDVMEYYAYVNGEFDNYHSTWKYKKLVDCAAYYGYTGNSWHDALDDARATLFCFNAICGNPPVIPDRHSGIYFNEDNSEPVKGKKKEKSSFKNSGSGTAPAADTGSVDFGNPKRKTSTYSVCGFIIIFLSVIMFLVALCSVVSAPVGGVIGIVLSIILFRSGRKFRRIARNRKMLG